MYCRIDYALGPSTTLDLDIVFCACVQRNSRWGRGTSRDIGEVSARTCMAFGSRYALGPYNTDDF